MSIFARLYKYASNPPTLNYMVSIKEQWHESFKIGTSAKAIIFIERSRDFIYIYIYIYPLYTYIYNIYINTVFIYIFYNINTEYKQNNIVTQWSFVQAEPSLECARLYWIFKYSVCDVHTTYYLPLQREYTKLHETTELQGLQGNKMCKKLIKLFVLLTWHEIFLILPNAKIEA